MQRQKNECEIYKSIITDYYKFYKGNKLCNVVEMVFRKWDQEFSPQRLNVN